MGWLDEQFSAQFARWEKRGRGWQVWLNPVVLEPPFIPFPGYAPETGLVTDDGHRQSWLSSSLTRLGLLMPPRAPTGAELQEPEVELDPAMQARGDLVELQMSFPARFSPKPREFAPVLAQLAFCREPLAFEILGTSESIVVQWAASAKDAPTIIRQVRAYFPEVVVTQTEDVLSRAWNSADRAEALVAEFGLAREFAYPLAQPETDPYVGLVGALSDLAPTEMGLFQVLFQPVENTWADSLLRAVTDAAGRPVFINVPELAKLAQEKVTSPLVAAVVRISVRAEDFDRTIDIARDMAAALRLFSRLDGNELVPLHNTEYPFEEHLEDVLCRQSRRSGMLLNTEELIGFVHLPTAAVRTPKLQRELAKTKAAPKATTQARDGLLLGRNTHAGQSLDVRLSSEDRSRHMHLIGASGTGKSSLLFNLIRQDIENDEGLALLDPHGDLVDRILGIIPPHRIHDVVLIDPSDEAYSVGFNILSAHTDLEKTLLASDLVSVFQRLSTSWGDQMGSVLQNAILAFLESSEGGTLSDLRRFLIEPAFRSQFLSTVRDPDIVYYWRYAFQQLTGNKSIGPTMTRLDTFLAPKPIRNMVSQKENKLDFSKIMDSGKIFLAKLSHGQIGKENAFLLGSLFVSKFQQTALSRQSQEAALRRPFWLYIDEFHNFITPSMAEILSGARKYRLGLILAHQELRQLQRDAEVASAVLSNCHTRVCFRLGDDDAKKLAEGFSFFEAEDLRNLNPGQAICRLERSDGDFNLAVPLPQDPDPDMAAATRQNVIQASRETYARPKSEVEEALWQRLNLAIPKPAEEPNRAEVPKPPAKSSVLTTKPDRKAERPKTEVLASEQTSKPAEISEPPKTLHPKSMGHDGEQLSIVQDRLNDMPAKSVEVPKTAATSPGLNTELDTKEPPKPDTLASELATKPVEISKLSKTGQSKSMGRGGEQHQAIQKRIKEAAEKLGFRSVIEKPVLDGQGSVDLWLERTGQAIACEISISTTIDHEVGNVAKCLKTDVQKVAVICLDEDRLKKIAVGISGSLGAELVARVEYFQPDSFIAHLKSMPALVPQTSETIHRGYRVKRSAPKLTAEEHRQREELANQMMAEAMRQKQKTPSKTIV